MKIFGGFYTAVLSQEDDAGLKVAFLTGPHKTWNEANDKLAAATQEASKWEGLHHYSTRNNFCVTFFQSPEIVLGRLNGPMWVTPNLEGIET